MINTTLQKKKLALRDNLKKRKTALRDLDGSNPAGMQARNRPLKPGQMKAGEPEANEVKVGQVPQGVKPANQDTSEPD
jgi:hypothetical protein